MAGDTLKKPLEAALKFWTDSQFRRKFTRDFYKQREEFASANFNAFDIGETLGVHARKRVDDPLAAAAILETIARDSSHSFQANALCEQGQYLVNAADDAYAEGWPQRQVETFWEQARAKFESAYQVATDKRQLMKSKRLEGLDWGDRSSLQVSCSAAAGLALCHLHGGDLGGATQWAQKVYSEDRWALKDLLAGAGNYGPGLPPEIQASAAQGPLWRPDSLRGEVVSPDLVYAEVNDDDPEVVRLTLWRWPVVDSQNRLQWREQDNDEHSLDIVPASFWVAMGQLGKRPTGNSILALRLKGGFPVVKYGEPNKEFGEVFSTVAAEITRDVHAKSLETVLSVGRDGPSA